MSSLSSLQLLRQLVFASGKRAVSGFGGIASVSPSLLPTSSSTYGTHHWCRFLSSETSKAARTERIINTAEGIPLRTGRPRLVVLGSGWASSRLLRDIDPKLYDLTVISQRNHMVFTPLLSSTTVGTLEPRSIAIHVTDIQKALFDPQNQLYIAEAKAVHPDRKLVEVTSSDGVRFFVAYDVLVIATGSQGSTFGIPGVLQHATFLRDIHDADVIRQRLMENVALAGIPGRSSEEWHRLLHIVVVGGGPTGVEVAGELTNFINRDLHRVYPDRAKAMRVTVVEAKELLGSFDESLREYAARTLVRRGVTLRKGVVKEVRPTEIELQDGGVLPYGLCIWSTGVGPTPFTLALPFAKTKVGRLCVDSYLRAMVEAPDGSSIGGGAAASARPSSSLPSQQPPAAAAAGLLTDESRSKSPSRLAVSPDVYALGDCCANPDAPLPALAQVAEQQGRYLARVLNERQRMHRSEPTEAFVYRPLGAMATVGGTSAILELLGPRKGLSMKGTLSWVAWRSAYLTRLGSPSKRISVVVNWFMTMLFGRDMSRW